MEKGYVDLPAATWYQYGYKEGIPRMLDNWDKLGIKVTSHMVGSAVLKNPQLAKEIIERGHEAAAHGMNWSSQYNLSYDAEKKFIQDGVDAIKKVTGATAIGYNANWLRRGENTLKILQELGFKYHIDDLSRDEPFIVQVNNKDFAVVPYTLRNNDILLIEGKNFSADQFFNQVKLEFDQLYAESEFKRRQMSISFHDRIGGTPQMVQVTKNLIEYMQQHKGVTFKRKDEIAEMTLNDRTSIRE
jgi:peptidoglycan/xylan/chitin deacetylase (PgdA/CDA1 family)